MSAPTGPLYDYRYILLGASDGSGYRCNLASVSRKVAIDDLIDARGVAELLGLAHYNTVSVYQHRYEDMPRPVLDLGKDRIKLWLRPEIERWAAERLKKGKRRAKSPRG